MTSNTGDADEIARGERARARSTWRVVRTDLAHQADLDLSSIAILERLALVWRLTQETWALSGRPLPDYSRAQMPGMVWRNDEAPIDE